MDHLWTHSLKIADVACILGNQGCPKCWNPLKMWRVQCLPSNQSINPGGCLPPPQLSRFCRSSYSFQPQVCKGRGGQREREGGREELWSMVAPSETVWCSEDAFGARKAADMPSGFCPRRSSLMMRRELRWFVLKSRPRVGQT